RGALICGVNPNLAGFGAPNAAGEYVGFDVDICRAVAAAILGDPERMAEMGAAARRFVESNLGASRRYAERIVAAVRRS
ncbi:MAG: hypothetical protein WHU10_04350, partial [Fimbriimonadales bacterium]